MTDKYCLKFENDSILYDIEDYRYKFEQNLITIRGFNITKNDAGHSSNAYLKTKDPNLIKILLENQNKLRSQNIFGVTGPLISKKDCLLDFAIIKYDGKIKDIDIFYGAQIEHMEIDNNYEYLDGEFIVNDIIKLNGDFGDYLKYFRDDRIEKILN